MRFCRNLLFFVYSMLLNHHKNSINLNRIECSDLVALVSKYESKFKCETASKCETMEHTRKQQQQQQRTKTGSPFRSSLCDRVVRIKRFGSVRIEKQVHFDWRASCDHAHVSRAFSLVFLLNFYSHYLHRSEFGI